MECIKPVYTTLFYILSLIIKSDTMKEKYGNLYTASFEIKNNRVIRQARLLGGLDTCRITRDQDFVMNEAYLNMN